MQSMGINYSGERHTKENEWKEIIYLLPAPNCGTH